MSAIRGGDQQQLSRGCVGQQLAGAVTAFNNSTPGCTRHFKASHHTQSGEFRGGI
jgi:hypothetical protein